MENNTSFCPECGKDVRYILEEKQIFKRRLLNSGQCCSVVFDGLAAVCLECGKEVVSEEAELYNRSQLEPLMKEKDNSARIGGLVSNVPQLVVNVSTVEESAQSTPVSMSPVNKILVLLDVLSRENLEDVMAAIEKELVKR